MKYKRFFSEHKRLSVAVVSTVTALIVIVCFVARNMGRAEKVIEPGNDSAAAANAPSDGSVGQYDFNEAANHIGEQAVVSGKIIKVFKSKSGVTFLDFCQNFQTCKFSAVIFASDLAQFKNVSDFEGKAVKVSGLIRSYGGKAEIILNGPDQIE